MYGVLDRVNTKIKYLGFKGVEKKEQILFKSYLNLAKNELDFQIVVLNSKAAIDDTPDLLITDSAYEFTEIDQEFKSLPMILVGNDIALDQHNYISRPVQWSDFKRALASLSFDEEQVGVEPQRLLPDQMRFAIKEIVEENSISVAAESASEEDEQDQADELELELGSMSVEYNSHTNSEYMKVVEDVQDFHGASAKDASGTPQAIVLVTDEESTSVNSVLVIETDSLDVWDMDSFIEDEEKQEETQDNPDPEETVSENEIENVRRQEIFKRLEAGETVSINDKYWVDGGEFFCDAEPLFIIRPGGESVYSAMEPAKWGVSMRNRELIKLPLGDSWEPADDLKVYPISRLPWANSIATNYSSLMDGVEENQNYMLQSWPDFELLELDNMLLKLCTMLYVDAESPQTLMEKTGYSRSVVYAFVNACHTTGILRHEDDIEKPNLAQINQQDSSMLNKIKDVFR